MLKMAYRIVDLFSGCGGLSRGFEWTGRFGTDLGVELHPHPASTFARNIRNAKGEVAAVYKGNIANLTADKALFRATFSNAGIHNLSDIDVVVGGPPCQGFSRNGPRLYLDDTKNLRFYDHPNNHLYKSFLFFVEEIRPKIVLVENVREFLNFGGGEFSSDLRLRFAELGYEVEFQKINAADFGVPQNRHRVFFIAVRKDVVDTTGVGPQFPRGLYRKSKAAGELELLPTQRTVRDAISDLPSPITDKHGIAHYDVSSIPSELAAGLRSRSGAVANHVIRRLSLENS